METTTFDHFVFVDFENVSDIDLDLIADQSAQVILLIGDKQKKLSVALVQQIHRHAAQVQLIEVGATGRNALDFTLAYYVGVISSRHPHAHLHIVSKDKDYDPLLRHLANHHVSIARHLSFAALPFAPQATPVPVTSSERLEKMIDRLKNNQKARPARKKTLLAHIQAFHGNQLSESQLAEFASVLIERGVIQIDARGYVTYC